LIAPTTTNADDGAFPPGTVIGQRYRIAGLLGRGGMGEVYRAHDLLVGQTVALKFLPEAWSHHEAYLIRLRTEVRTARMVTHPNVCRVHDLGEAEGRLFVSMEYVDGEDLSSLLRRIGRLPEDKGIEIARKLCAGLAAAHEKGVIHRDLKPANIMIDGRGEVVITDFGLAGLAGQIADVRSGTPAYMAPEQQAGIEVTARSDIYSLGVVLKEMFGSKAASSAAATPGAAPLAAAALPDAVAAIVERCLAVDPAQRPSAMQIARALPGGDPLAAALAAGATPSPEMVAQGGEHLGLAPKFAVPLLLLALALPVAVLMQGSTAPDFPVMAPEELAQQARRVVLLGSTESRSHTLPAAPPPNELFGYSLDTAMLARLQAPDMDLATQRAALYGPRQFWYRIGPVPLGSRREFPYPFLDYSDPPIDRPGEAAVLLDGRGRLKRYEAVLRPTGTAQSGPPQSGTPDWQPYLQMTSAEAANLKVIAQDSARTVWEHRDPAGLRYTFTGRSRGNQVESFIVAGSHEDAAPSPIAGWLIPTMLILAAVFFAWRNIAANRADLPGGLKLGLVIFVLSGAGFFLRGHDLFRWNFDVTPVDALMIPLLTTVIYSIAFWAVEPFLRRRWPSVLVTWTRLLQGRWRDATVGRDVLIGLAVAQLFHLVVSTAFTFGRGEGAAFGPALSPRWDAYLGARNVAGALLSMLNTGLLEAVFMAFLMFLLRRLLRNDRLTIAAAMLLMSPIAAGLFGVWNPAALATFATLGGLVASMLVRFGFLSIVAFWTALEFQNFPLTLDPSQWFFAYSFALTAFTWFLALLAFRTSLGGQRLLNDAD
jgi:serine/threonine-protein kinase